MTRREFLDAVGLALTGALAGFLTGRALVGEEVVPYLEILDSPLPRKTR